MFVRIAFSIKNENQIFITYYAEACNDLCGLAPGQQVSETISQGWRVVDDTLSDLTCLRIEPQISRTFSYV